MEGRAESYQAVAHDHGRQAGEPSMGHRVWELDKLYQRVVQALDRLLQAVGLKAA
jgi:hypothetical protein